MNADIHMKIMFENAPSVHLTVYSLDSLYMLRMRDGLHLFDYIWLYIFRECSGSVVECLTRDRRAAGSSLTGVTALWSLSKTHLS